MAISLGGFVISRLLAERSGVQDSAQLTRISLIGAVIGASPVGLLMTNELARREAQNAVVVAPSPGGGGGTPGGGGTGGTPLVHVPDFTNMNFEQAKSLAGPLGLQARQVPASSNIEAIGEVLIQNPDAGVMVTRGSTVTLIVSQGVQVPNLVGSTVDESRKIVSALGLVLQVKNELSSASVGTVVAQAPAAGTMVSPHSSISLTISQGPNITVPDVTHRFARRAEEILREAGFNVTRQEQPSHIINKDYVIEQSPAAGTLALPGDLMTITVSTGVGIKVPDLSNMTSDEAEDALENAGLSARIVQQRSKAVAEGYVISQDPKVDTIVDPGSEVTVVVSQGSEPAFIELPDFKGAMFHDAQELLQDFNFIIRRVDQDSDKPKDMVIDQEPAPGFVRPESTVTLTVSTGKYKKGETTGAWKTETTDTQ